MGIWALFRFQHSMHVYLSKDGHYLVTSDKLHIILTRALFLSLSLSLFVSPSLVPLARCGEKDG